MAPKVYQRIKVRFRFDASALPWNRRRERDFLRKGGLPVDCPKAQAVLICCTDFNTLNAIAPLEAAPGKLVVSSNICSLRTVPRKAGIEARIEGHGSLLAEH